MVSNYYAEIYKKFQNASRNCGLKICSKTESIQNIIERINQLELDEKTDTPEYHLMLAILQKINNSTVKA